MTLFRNSIICLLVLGALSLTGCSDGDNKEAQTEERAEPATSSAPASSVSYDLLMRASLNGQLDVVRRAADQGVDLDRADEGGRTPLMLAAFNGHSDVVEFLLEEGASVEKKNSEGRSPLIFAASGSNPETVELLLEHGADPNVTDNVQEWSALMFAAAEGHVDVVRTLLAHGANPSLEDEDGETALDFARDSGHTQVVKLLEGQ